MGQQQCAIIRHSNFNNTHSMICPDFEIACSNTCGSAKCLCVSLFLLSFNYPLSILSLVVRLYCFYIMSFYGIFRITRTTGILRACTEG